MDKERVKEVIGIIQFLAEQERKSEHREEFKSISINLYQKRIGELEAMIQ